MNTNYAFVLDADRRPLSPCHPARARELLKKGKAAVIRWYPFTIILKRAHLDAAPAPCQVKLDPGSKTTGIALVQGERVIWSAELTHRGAAIKGRLADRRARRRNRRNRLRYRQPSYRTKGQIRKGNRKQLGWPKAHWLDAAAVGCIGALRLATERPLLITCKGQGGRQKGVFDNYGQPKRNKQGKAQIRPLKPIHGWRSGDIARCAGVVGRISPRTTGSFEMRPMAGGKPFSRPRRLFTPIHKNDGYGYAHRLGA